MTNPRNTTNLSMSEDLYNRLNKIKTEKNWTFDTLIRNLCELEMKNNYIENMSSYNFVTSNSDGVFRAIFKKNTFSIEYLTTDGYSNDINEWDISNSDKKIFLKFIHKECARCILENLEMVVGFNKFDIYKMV